MTKTALITGASSGIGEVFARRLAGQGYDLIVVARSKDKLDGLAAELAERHQVNVAVIAIDLSVAGSAQEVYNQTERQGKRVDLLINNAGFGLSGEFLNHSPEEYRKQVMLNVASVVELTHLYMPNMLRKGEGAVINVASLLSFLPFPYCSVYSATKAFVLSFTESLWEEYRHKGIRLLALCPGPTDTNFFATAKDVETKKKRTPEQAVNTALNALGRSRSFVIDGRNNYLTALLSRLLPRKTMVRMLGKAMRQAMGKAPRTES